MDYSKLIDKRTLIKKLHTLIKHSGNYEPTWKEKEGILNSCSVPGSCLYGLNYSDSGVIYHIDPKKARNEYVENLTWILINNYMKDSELANILLDIKFQISIKKYYMFKNSKGNYNIKVENNCIDLMKNFNLVKRIYYHCNTDYNIELLKIIFEYKIEKGDN